MNNLGGVNKLRVDKIKDTSNLTRLYLNDKAYISNNDEIIDEMYKQGLVKIFLLKTWSYPNIYNGSEMYMCYVEIVNPLINLESYSIKLLSKDFFSTNKSIFEQKGIKIRKVTRELVEMSNEHKSTIIPIEYAIPTAIEEF